MRTAELIYHGVLDRFPRLQIVLDEVDVGWVGYFVEQLDDRYARQNPAQKVKLDHMPSAYYRRNFHYGIVKDAFGIRNRDVVGADRILWSSDFPHATCDYPDYAKAIAGDFAGVPDAERRLIVHDNAAALYGLAVT